MSASRHFDDIAGIIGGVGPEATSYFISLIIKERQKFAKTDQDHVPFLAFNNPQIPDRTEYLIHNKENPLPELIHTANLLKSAGATFLAIPCNTSHAFVDKIERTVDLEVINMIQLAVLHIVEKYGPTAKVGLLATDGTVQSKIFHKEFKKIAPQLKIKVPNKKSQKKVMAAIYGEKGIKTMSVNPYNASLLYECSQELLNDGASVIIAGCTEIPLVFRSSKSIFPIIDPMELMAKEVVNRTMASKVKRFTKPQLFSSHRSFAR